MALKELQTIIIFSKFKNNTILKIISDDGTSDLKPGRICQDQPTGTLILPIFSLKL